MNPPMPVGDAPYLNPVELEQFTKHGCGHCGIGTLFSPFPDAFLPGVLTEYEALRPDAFAAVYKCTHCGKPSVVVHAMRVDADRRPSLTEKSVSYPRGIAKPLDVTEYEETAIEAYRNEAWACGYSGFHRAALVLARSTLQALCRRYLPKKVWSMSGLGPEVAEVEKIAGAGWKAIGDRIKVLADEWAHPGSASQPPSSKASHDSLSFMDDVLRMTASMERAGVLRPARWTKK